uniref:Uncharacterized protein n=1 Tax=Utricularia reniformis TaxID=192314 RepID=A0A1Y0AYV4_9LAMI|nr:hypothetical protein AEK19_MT0899 [Utricularia reniformis]ART30328.1 hypothetical protein AEK19_MT0899 [Utricularia reniformis]
MGGWFSGCWAARLLNRKEWESRGDFGKPMYELKRDGIALVRIDAVDESQKQAESKAGQTHISGGD